MSLARVHTVSKSRKPGTCEKCSTECEGNGEVDCQTCEGTGEVTVEGDGYTTEGSCAECDGTGKVECPVEECEDGQVPDLDAMREAATEALETDLGC